VILNDWSGGWGLHAPRSSQVCGGGVVGGDNIVPLFDSEGNQGMYVIVREL
jgi:hypothetical protein